MLEKDVKDIKQIIDSLEARICKISADLDQAEEQNQVLSVGEKIERLKHEIEEPYDDEGLDPETAPDWMTTNWRYHFYGSGDPANTDESFIRNLTHFTFNAFESLIDIVSDLQRQHDDVLEVALESIARIQNTIDDLIFTNELNLSLDHSKSAVENKILLDDYKSARNQRDE